MVRDGMMPYIVVQYGYDMIRNEYEVLCYNQRKLLSSELKKAHVY